jgi:hypothetical protein
MKLSLQDLKSIAPERLWLAYSSANRARAELAAQGHANPTASHNAYLNRLCLDVFGRWVRENWEMTPAVWPDDRQLASIWEAVNGTALVIEQTRLVLIPSDALDTEMLSVPQEWVDIPKWAADYYLAVQIDLEGDWLCIWGYTSHRTLKTKGNYDPIWRTYSLSREAIVPDLEVMWVAATMGLKETAQIHPLPALMLPTAETLIHQLSQPSPYSPRLEVEFERWAALLERDDWRSQLYRQRQQNAGVGAGLSAAKPVLEQRSRESINVGLWLQEQIDRLAQQMSWVLLPPLALEGAAMRSIRSPVQEIAGVVTQLKSKGISIPIAARGAYQDLLLGDSRLRLYAVTWSAMPVGSVSQWFLLLVLAPEFGCRLLEETTMQISDDTKVLTQSTLPPHASDDYIYAAVSGSWSETFSVTLSLVNGISLTLPPFAFGIQKLTTDN